MGSGRDGRPASYTKKNFSLEKLKLSSMKDDLTVLRHMWFGSKKGDDHAARLESFYGPQAAACKSRLTLCSFKCFELLTRCLPAQMMLSGRGSSGVAGPCSLQLLPAWPSARTSSGLTWVVALG